MSRPVAATSGDSRLIPTVQERHVAVDGDDTGDGSQTHPFATLDTAVRAAATIQGSRRIVLHGGRHVITQTLVLGPEHDGLVVTAAPGVRPVISGGRRITGWQESRFNDQDCWSADATGGFTQLFVNGQRRTRPRLPKTGFYRFESIGDQLDIGYDWGNGPDSATYLPGDIKAWRNLAEIELTAYQLWFETHHRIREVDEDQRIVRFRARSLGSLIDEDRLFARYRLENVAEAFDSPGEWYLDRQAARVYYLPLPSEGIDDFDAVAPAVEMLVRFAGCRDVRVENVSFQHAEWRLPSDDPGFIQAAFGVPGAITFDGAADCVLYGCEIAHVSQYGVEMLPGSSGNKVIACEIHDVGAGGVKIGHDGMDRIDPTSRATVADVARPMHATVSDCTIHDAGHIYSGAIGIWIGNSGRNRVIHNELFDLPYTGISAGWAWGYQPTHTVDNRIEANHIHHVNWDRLLSDNGAIYTLGIQPGSTIVGNVIDHVGRHSYGGWGIYTDEGSSEFRIENNVVHHTDDAGFHVHFGRDLVIRNNILALSGAGHVRPGKPEGHRTGVFEHNVMSWTTGGITGRQTDWGREHFLIGSNLIWRADGGPVTIDGTPLAALEVSGQFVGSIVADPLFAAPGAGDFGLRKDSPAMRVGFVPFDVSAVGPRVRNGVPASFEKWPHHDDEPRPIVRTLIEIDPSDQTDPDDVVAKLTFTNVGASHAEADVAVLNGRSARLATCRIALEPGKTQQEIVRVARQDIGDGLAIETVSEGVGLIPAYLPLFDRKLAARSMTDDLQFPEPIVSTATDLPNAVAAVLNESPERVDVGRRSITVANGIPFSAITWGGPTGEPVVLIHGVTASARIWWRVGPALAAAGYRVIAPDLPGHGFTGQWAGHVRFRDTAADLAAWFRANGVDGDEVRIVGHSWGAMVAAALPIAGIRPKTLVLLDPPSSPLFDPTIARVEGEPAQRPYPDRASAIAGLTTANPTWSPMDVDAKAEAIMQLDVDAARSIVLDNVWDGGLGDISDAAGDHVAIWVIRADPVDGGYVADEVLSRYAARIGAGHVLTLANAPHAPQRTHAAAATSALLRAFEPARRR